MDSKYGEKKNKYDEVIKEEIMTVKMRLRVFVTVMMLLLGLSLIAETQLTNDNDSKQRQGNMKKKDYIVKNLPEQSEKLMVEGNPYYVNKGVYYRKGHDGYRIVRAPYGVRVKHLPDGIRVIRRQGVEYYYYYNTYYRYDVNSDVYIVINEPEWADKNFQSDKLNLMNGSVLVGRYLGGDSETVRFLFGGEKRVVPVEEIISIEFAPAIYEGNDY